MNEGLGELKCRRHFVLVNYVVKIVHACSEKLMKHIKK